MIPKDFITEWREHAPWIGDAQVEQDLVISRAVVEIFQDDVLAQRLAFRGGTALFKLYLTPAARYSEDIDLVQVAPEPIGDTLDRLRARLDPWLGTPRRLIRDGLVHLAYRFTSEEEPPKPMRLKVEINTEEHFTELGHAHVPFEVKSRWWNGAADIRTYSIDELLGTKLRALYQRRKGRDLFDLWYAVSRDLATPELIVQCFERYMSESELRVTRAVFEQNLLGKQADAIFRRDMTPLLRGGVGWDVDEATAVVMAELIAKLRGEPWRLITD
jgi:predicted nucleotidyltransferase component of viral defense system